MPTKIYLNGQIDDEAHISVFDRGFLYGDSVYEVVATKKGRPCFLKEHLFRLRNSAEAIGIEMIWSDETLQCEIEKTVMQAGNAESYIRIVITRGEGEIDIDPASSEKPNLLIYVTPLHSYPREHYERGIHISLVSILRNPKEALNPRVKTGNYLNNVLAKMEANRRGGADALMLNAAGFLTECTTSNFFFVCGERLMTPSLDCGILEGITRDAVIQLAREQGIVVEEGAWPPDILLKADEAFISGTVRKLMPVVSIDQRLINDGTPGPTTIKLIELYEKLLESI